MKRLLLAMIMITGLGFGGVLLATDPPVLDIGQKQHKSADTMSVNRCMTCHKMGMNEAPVAPAHCQCQSDCMSCHL